MPLSEMPFEHVQSKIETKYCRERESSVTYKNVERALDLLDTRRIQHLMTIVCSGALASSHSYSLQSTITRAESSWSAVPHYLSGAGFQRRTSQLNYNFHYGLHHLLNYFCVAFFTIKHFSLLFSLVF
jgi:hypothetical protein